VDSILASDTKLTAYLLTCETHVFQH